MAHQLLSLVRPAASLGKPYPTYVYKIFNAFHATPSTYTQTPSVHPASDKEAFVRGLRASGLSIEQAQGGVPMVLHDIRKALKPWSLPASDLHYDKQKIRDLFRSVQIKGNEPAFVSSTFIVGPMSSHPCGMVMRCRSRASHVPGPAFVSTPG